MIAQARFVGAVKFTVGTPYKHRGRIAGVGLDCVGVPMCALAMCGVILPEPPPYGMFPGSIIHGLTGHCIEVPMCDRTEGDLLAILWKNEPRHAAVIVSREGDADMIVHALARIGKVAMHQMHRGYRVHSCWRFREVG